MLTFIFQIQTEGRGVAEKDELAEGEKEKVRKRLVGGWGVQLFLSVSVCEVDLATCRSPHSCAFLGSHRQSVVRGPGTDLGSACQQQISLIEISRTHEHICQIQEDTRKTLL